MFREEITTFALTQSVSDLALNFGEGDTTTKQKPMARPFGVAMLIGGIDKNGPELYSTGTYFPICIKCLRSIWNDDLVRCKRHGLR